MDLDVVFLGTGGSVPTARRATACVLVRRGGERLLFDCGEGAQRQMQRSTGLVQLDEIYVTHLHADHYLGIPGLLKTYDLQLELVELAAGEGIAHDGYEVRSFPVAHRISAYGYALVEAARPGRFDPDAAARLGVSPGPDYGRLQRGEEVPGGDGSLVRPEQVMGDARPSRKVVVSGDTTPCEMTKIAAHRAELLIHDGSFADEETQRAAETGHSTARQAAEIARSAEVAMLALVHVSSRYQVDAVVAEAREVMADAFAPRDFDLVEIPLPERGPPVLIERGGRERREAAPAPVEAPAE